MDKYINYHRKKNVNFLNDLDIYFFFFHFLLLSYQGLDSIHNGISYNLSTSNCTEQKSLVDPFIHITFRHTFQVINITKMNESGVFLLLLLLPFSMMNVSYHQWKFVCLFFQNRRI